MLRSTAVKMSPIILIRAWLTPVSNAMSGGLKPFQGALRAAIQRPEGVNAVDS